jgi:hypothetical protein
VTSHKAADLQPTGMHGYRGVAQPEASSRGQETVAARCECPGGHGGPPGTTQDREGAAGIVTIGGWKSFLGHGSPVAAVYVLPLSWPNGPVHVPLRCSPREAHLLPWLTGPVQSAHETGFSRLPWFQA